MKSQCIQAVEKAIGRKLADGEAKRIEDRIAGNARELARTDPNFRNLTPEDRLLAAAQRAFQQDAQAATKTAQRKASNALAQVRETRKLTDRANQVGGKTPYHRALFERLRIIDNSVNALRKEILSDLIDTVQAAEPEFLGLIYSRQGTVDFVREAFQPGSTGNPVAQRGAKAYLDAIEKYRQRQNAAGADIGRLDYAYLPQPHDVGLVATAGKQKWVEATANLVDRSRYVNDDGTPFNDQQLRDFLGNAFDTIATEGRNKLTPSASAPRGSRASRFDEAHRQIHFTSADAYLEYQSQFGRGGSVFEAIQSHVGQTAKNIALLEEFGASPNATFELLRQTAEKADNRRGVSEGTATLDNAWQALNGTLNSPVNPDLAQLGNNVRSFVAATKLQGVVLSAIPDIGSIGTSAIYNGLPLGQTARNIISSFGGAKQRELARLGIATDYIAGELSRFHADTISSGFFQKLGSLTSRLSLIDRWTNSLRTGYALSLHAHLGEMIRKDWGSLKQLDRNQLEAAGVSEADWMIWQQAAPVSYRGQRLLNADALRQVGGAPEDINRAIVRLNGFVDQQTKTAILQPDLNTRAGLTLGTKAGTVGGEFARSLLLFKSFPIAVVNRYLQRLATIPDTKGKLAYSAAHFTALTVLGGVAIELKDIIAGKDPRDITSAKFWGAAAIQGGGLGVFGDVFYTGLGGDSASGRPNFAALAGPVFGTGIDLLNLTLANAGQAARGKDSNLGAELFRFGANNTPLIRLWYIRAALNHAILDDVQESLSPGYLARTRRRAEQDWGQRYFWEPGSGLPDRGPDLSAVIGGSTQ